MWHSNIWSSYVVALMLSKFGHIWQKIPGLWWTTISPDHSVISWPILPSNSQIFLFKSGLFTAEFGFLFFFIEKLTSPKFVAKRNNVSCFLLHIVHHLCLGVAGHSPHSVDDKFAIKWNIYIYMENIPLVFCFVFTSFDIQEDECKNSYHFYILPKLVV